MGEKQIKYFYWLFAALLLVLMVAASRYAGISCDEVLHYQQSVSVYDYFASGGKDTSALNTPVTHLKYYGQSYDNLATILINWFDIKDVYGLRHIMSSFAGWLAILITSLLAVWLKDHRTGLMVLLLFALSPTFLGHSQNNLKDVPFSLGYIAGVYFTMKVLFSETRLPVRDYIFLLISIAFCISIRAGGLLLICYLFLFYFLFYLYRYLKDRTLDFHEAGIRLLLITGISVAGVLLSIILWPYALSDPLRNIIGSYRIMAHFPDSFRQIFEGTVQWSDNMPWYYLIKSLAITVPLIVLAGLILFFLFIRRYMADKQAFKYIFLLFTILFPLVFVVFEDSNLYSSWRQFLFVYPGIIILAAVGFSSFDGLIRNRYVHWAVLPVALLLAIHPVKFMLGNIPYSYIYYNQLVGGLKGAYGNYETDYYYISQTKASEWLIEYLEEKGISAPVKVKATYSVKWQFRNHPEIETSYFRFADRSQYDWDYAIVVNRYIPPFQLKNKIWPPENAIHIVYADEVPLCAVLERKSKSDYYGFMALQNANYEESIAHFEDVLKINDKDELIFYNFATALFYNGEFEKADSALKKGLEINPECEPILMYLGNISRDHNNTEEAVDYYKKLIGINRKYFEAYIELAKLLAGEDMKEARSLLRQCLTINPRYKPAISALADTYRETDPEVAEKYDELLKTIE